MGELVAHVNSVGLIQYLNAGFVSPQFHVIYDLKYQTVSGGYDDNEAVASYIWDSLVQNEREDVLTKANI